MDPSFSTLSDRSVKIDTPYVDGIFPRFFVVVASILRERERCVRKSQNQLDKKYAYIWSPILISGSIWYKVHMNTNSTFLNDRLHCKQNFGIK